MAEGRRGVGEYMDVTVPLACFSLLHDSKWSSYNTEISKPIYGPILQPVTYPNFIKRPAHIKNTRHEMYVSTNI